MIGENAYLGENARFAKVGSEAWGTVTEESGTVLFDGVVTLRNTGLLFTTEELDAPAPVVGKTYTLHINGISLTGVAADYEGGPGVNIMDGDTPKAIYGEDGVVYFGCSSAVGHEGENTLKIVQND